MFERIKKDKKSILIFNLSIIVFSWLLFFSTINLVGKKLDIFLKGVFGESFFSSLIFLLGIPFVFLLVLKFLVVAQNSGDKKKWIIRGVIIPFVAWSVFIVSAVLLFYFFGWSGY